MNRREILKGLPVAVASGGILLSATSVASANSPFAQALVRWNEINANGIAISDRHTLADRASWAYNRENLLQTKWHDLSDRRGYDYARENIGNHYRQIRSRSFIDLNAVNSSEREALELIDNIETQEAATPVAIELEAANKDYEQWLDDQTEAFLDVCGAPTQSVEEAMLKQATIRDSDIARGCYVEPEWFAALLSSIA